MLLRKCKCRTDLLFAIFPLIRWYFLCLLDYIMVANKVRRASLLYFLNVELLQSFTFAGSKRSAFKHDTYLLHSIT
jgi:hypothetical protein